MSEGYTPTEATAASGNTRHAEQAKLETSYKGGGQPLSFLRKHINSGEKIQMNHNSDGQQARCERRKLRRIIICNTMRFHIMVKIFVIVYV